MKDASGKETKLPARIDSYKDQGVEPPLPSLTARHVYDWLMEIGPVEAGGMAAVPISWATIDAWARRTFARPNAWEARLLRRLSAEWLSASQKAEDHMCPAPWSPEPAEIDHGAAERQLRRVLG